LGSLALICMAAASQLAVTQWEARARSSSNQPGLLKIQRWRVFFGHRFTQDVLEKKGALNGCCCYITRSVAAGFGRHGMPLPASNDTGTTLGQDGSDWSRDLATFSFDLGGHGTCGWCGSSSAIRIQSFNFVDLAVRKIWCTICVSINGPGDLDIWPFDLETGMRVASKVGSHQRLGLWVLKLLAMYAVDRWTNKSNTYCPFPMGEGIITSIITASALTA